MTTSVAGTSQAKTHTVILAPPGPSRGILAALQDWSALGLVGDFFWVEPAGVTEHEVRAAQVRDGRLTGVSLVSALTAEQAANTQVCVLVPMLAHSAVVSANLEQHLAEVVDGTTLGIATRVRCVFSRPTDTPSAGVVAREGWRNIVLASQDAEGPDAPEVRLPPSNDTAEVGCFAAVTLAGVLGLWTGAQHEKPPLEQTTLVPGESARLATSFVRSLDATEVEQALRRAVTSTERGFPRPWQQGNTAVYVENVEAATSRMAEALWQRHAATLRGPRVEAQKRSSDPIGAFEALKMFFGFLWSALKNAPGAWLRAIKRRAATRVAARVHGLVFGANPSAWTVVVQGMTPDGTPASWLTMGNAASQLEAALADSGLEPGQEGHADLGSLWQGYVAGALTLADGKERFTYLPPVTLGADLAVIRRPEDVAPSAQFAFHELAGQVAAAVGETGVLPYDYLGTEELIARLQTRVHTPGLELDVDRARAELGRWRAKVRASYAMQVGERLGKALEATVSEVRSLLQSLHAAAGSDDTGAEAEQQRRLGRRMRLISLVFLVIFVIIGVLTGIGVLALALGLALGGVTVLGASLALLRTFLVGQRELFRVLNRQRDAMLAAEAAALNLRQALKDLRRLTEAYGQFLEWSKLLSVVLASPFGTHEATAGIALRMDERLPRAMKVGVASVDNRRVEELAADIRDEIFGVGWLGKPWDELIEAAPARLGTDGAELRQSPESMYGKHAASTVGADSILTKWVQLISHHGVGTRSGDELWSYVLKSLQDSRAADAAALLAPIRVVSSGGTDPDLSTFMAGVHVADRARGDGRFDSTVLTPTAANSREAQAETFAVRGSMNGLSRTAVLTVFSGGIQAYQFDFGDAGSRPRPSWEDADHPVLPPRTPPNDGDDFTVPGDAGITF